MKRLFVVLIIASLYLPGCNFLSKKSGSSNPIGPVITPEPEITNSVATGTATITIKFVLPEKPNLPMANISMANVRASMSAPYVTATLYKCDLSARIGQEYSMFMKRSVAVTNGSANVSFDSLPELRNGKIEIDLVGCNINSFTKFSGVADIIADTPCEVSVFPIAQDGSYVTADFRVLKEIAPGRVYRGLLTFDALGNPLGWSQDNYLENYITGEKYFSFVDLFASIKGTELDEGSDFHITDFAYLNGEFYVGGGECICKVNPDMKSLTRVLGKPGVFGVEIDGASLADAEISVVSDLCVYNNRLYFVSGMSKIVEMGDANISVYGSFYGSNMGISDSGDPMFVGSIADGKCFVAKMTGKDSYEKVSEEIYPNQQTSAISYQGGYLIASEKHIRQVYPDGTSRIWLDFGDAAYGDKFYIYKNSAGGVYIAAERMRKLWAVE